MNPTPHPPENAPSARRTLAQLFTAVRAWPSRPFEEQTPEPYAELERLHAEACDLAAAGQHPTPPPLELAGLALRAPSAFGTIGGVRTWAPLQDENPVAWYWWVGEVERLLGIRHTGSGQGESAEDVGPPSADKFPCNRRETTLSPANPLQELDGLLTASLRAADDALTRFQSGESRSLVAREREKGREIRYEQLQRLRGEAIRAAEAAGIPFSEVRPVLDVAEDWMRRLEDWRPHGEPSGASEALADLTIAYRPIIQRLWELRGRLEGRRLALSPRRGECVMESADIPHHATPDPIPPPSLTIGGCQVLRDVTPEELNGCPAPACGRFVIVREIGTDLERLALLWDDSDGAATLETGTDSLTVLGDPSGATWLPDGWRMRHYPTGLALPNLEQWFRCIFAFAGDETFAVGPDFGAPSCPTVRGMVAHAYMIVRHYGFPDSPKEPQQLLDREGYITNLREVLHFLRLHLDDGPCRMAVAAQGVTGAGQSECSNPRLGLDARLSCADQHESGIRDEAVQRLEALSGNITALARFCFEPGRPGRLPGSGNNRSYVGPAEFSPAPHNRQLALHKMIEECLDVRHSLRKSFPGLDLPEPPGMPPALCELPENDGRHWHEFKRAVERLNDWIDSCHRAIAEFEPGDSATPKDQSSSPTNLDPEPAKPPAESTEKRRGGTVNQRMLEHLNREPESAHWSQRRWATFLGCKPSAVAKTPAWKTAKAARALAVVDRLDRPRK
jgi:hypothetical protein